MRRILMFAALCGLICQATGCYRSYMADVGVIQDETEQPTSENVVETTESGTISMTEETVQGAAQTAEVAETTEQAQVVTSEQTEEPNVVPETAEVTDEESEEATEDEQLPMITAEQTVFVDYGFYENYEGNSDPDACGEHLFSAMDALMQTEEFKVACAALDSGKELVGADTERYDDPEILNEYVHDFYEVIEGGGYAPLFHCTYIEDYDGDGSQEQFVLFKFPYCPDYDEADDSVTIYCRYYLVFVGADGHAKMVDHFWGLGDVVMLDYGADKQLLFYSTGIYGADDHDPLYGVVNGRVKNMYGIRGGYEKWECFLTTGGWQGTGAFMYYDTVAKEYRSIVGTVVDKELVAQMDSTGAIGFEPDEYYQMTFVGGKYYLLHYGAMDSGAVFVYEDGEFVPVEGCGVRTPNADNPEVLLDDIDAAIEGMIDLEQAEGGTDENVDISDVQADDIVE